MNTESIKIPIKFPDIEKSFINLISIFDQFRNHSDYKINFDFSQNTFFAGNLCAVLGGIISYLKEKGNTVEINLDETNNSYKYLSNNGFLSVIEPLRFKKDRRNCIPYKEFSKGEISEFDDYLENSVLSHIDFPKVTVSLKNALLESLAEIFSNCYDHSCRETKIFTSGQSFYRSNPRIVFTLVDMGIGFCKCYEKKFGKNRKPSDIIDWCIQKGNTTKAFSGGLGYDVITKFIKANEGSLQIYSNNGLWTIKNNEIRKSELDFDFEGSIINLQLNIDKKYIYKLES